MAGIESKSQQGNLADWRLRLQGIDAGRSFGRQLLEKADPYAAASLLGLPVPAYRKVASIADFIKQPETELNPLSNLGISHFYVGLRTTDENLPKFRTEKPLPKEEVIPYIQQRISPQNYDKYSLRVAEYVVAVCGMVIVINPSGNMHADMIMGDLGPLATGESTPEYKARTDRFTNILRYTTADPTKSDNLPAEYDRQFQLREDHPIITSELREAIASGLRRIPKRLSGRYELAIVDHAGILVPIYVDAQPDGPNDHPYAFPEEPLY